MICVDSCCIWENPHLLNFDEMVFIGLFLKQTLKSPVIKVVFSKSIIMSRMSHASLILKLFDLYRFIKSRSSKDTFTIWILASLIEVTLALRIVFRKLTIPFPFPTLIQWLLNPSMSMSYIVSASRCVSSRWRMSAFNGAGKFRWKKFRWMVIQVKNKW